MTRKVLGVMTHADGHKTVILEPEATPYVPLTRADALRRIACYVLTPHREELHRIADYLDSLTVPSIPRGDS